MTNPTDPRVEAAIDAVIKARGWRDSCWGDGAIGGFDYSTNDKKRYVIRDHEAEAKEGKTVTLFETEDYDEYQREYRRICIRREVRSALKAADKAAWQPIETAPTGVNGISWMQLAKIEGEETFTWSGMHIHGKFYVAGLFHKGGEVPYEFRQHEVQPTHWQPLPTPPENP